MATRVHRPGWLRTLRKIANPKRTLKAWAKKKTRKIVKKKTVRMKTPPGMIRKGGFDSITPGRTIIEWLPHPEMGHGRVIGFMPGRELDVQFYDGTRVPYGIRIEEIRVLA